MAGQYTPEEYQDILDAYTKALISGMDQNSAAFKQLKENLDDARLGIKNYTYQMRQASQQLGSSMLAAGKQISSGAQGAAVFNDALTSGANLASKALERFGPWGQALGLATKALGAWVGAVAKQSDALYKSYQEISRTGAIGAGGMTEVYHNLKKFGYGIDELGNMGALLADNGKNLALFGGSVGRGTKQIADLARGVKDSDLQRQFMNLGLSVDAQNQMIAGYAVQQGRLGKSTDLTTKGMTAYIREQEILTRLTGQSAREMQEQFEAALQMDDFMAGIMDMPEEAQKQAKIVINQLSAIDPSGKMARGFAASVNGLGHTTEEGAQMYAASNGKIQEAALALSRGTLNASDFMQQYGDAVSQNIPTMKGLSKVGANYMGNLATNVRLTQLSGKGFAKVFDETGRSVDNAAAGMDSTTDAATRLRIAQMNSRDSMENFLQVGVGPVTTAMQMLAKVVEYLYRLLPGSSYVMNSEKEKQRLEAEKAQLDKDIVARKQQLDDVAKKQAELEQAKKEGKPSEVVAAKEAELREVKTALETSSGDLAQATAALASQQAEKVKESEKELEQIKRSKQEAEKDARVRLSIARTAEEKAKAEQESTKIAQELLAKEKKAKADLETATAEKSKLDNRARLDRLGEMASSAQRRIAAARVREKPESTSTATAPAAPTTGSAAPAAPTGGSAAPAAPTGGSAAPAAPTTGSAVGSKVSEKPIAAVLSAGPGFTTVSTTDNDKQQRKGARNWRNNNPGNIEFGKFAQSLGAVGTDGRFAVFPTMQAGMKAKEELLFGTKSKYTNLSIADAIARYAPPSENNTNAYIKAVTDAASVTSDTTLNSLNASQRSAFLAAISRQEGLRTGDVLQAAKGNVFTGPNSGYRAMLHGTEAVVPLPDGRTIPVTIAGLSEQNDRLAQVLSAIETRLGTDTSNNGGSMSDTLIKKLDDLIRVASDQLGVSGKILKAQA